MSDFTYRLTIFSELHWSEHLDPISGLFRKSAYLGRLEDEKGVKGIYYADNRLSVSSVKTNSENAAVLVHESVVDIRHLPRSQLQAVFITLNVLPGHAQLRRLISAIHKFND